MVITAKKLHPATPTLKVRHTSTKVKQGRSLRLAKEIARYDRVDSIALNNRKAPGQRYQQLHRELNANELVDLLNYGNATVKAYAFWSLAQIAHRNLESILLSYKGNDEMVNYQSNGRSRLIRLVDFMLDIAIQESYRMGQILVSEGTILGLRRQL